MMESQAFPSFEYSQTARILEAIATAAGNVKDSLPGTEEEANSILQSSKRIAFIATYAPKLLEWMYLQIQFRLSSSIFGLESGTPYDCMDDPHAWTQFFQAILTNSRHGTYQLFSALQGIREILGPAVKLCELAVLALGTARAFDFFNYNYDMDNPAESERVVDEILSKYYSIVDTNFNPVVMTTFLQHFQSLVPSNQQGQPEPHEPDFPAALYQQVYNTITNTRNLVDFDPKIACTPAWKPIAYQLLIISRTCSGDLLQYANNLSQDDRNALWLDGLVAAIDANISDTASSQLCGFLQNDVELLKKLAVLSRYRMLMLNTQDAEPQTQRLLAELTRLKRSMLQPFQQ